MYGDKSVQKLEAMIVSLSQRVETEKQQLNENVAVEAKLRSSLAQQIDRRNVDEIDEQLDEEILELQDTILEIDCEIRVMKRLIKELKKKMNKEQNRSRRDWINKAADSDSEKQVIGMIKDSRLVVEKRTRIVEQRPLAIA
jgi:signal recognition particle GTPase